MKIIKIKNPKMQIKKTKGSTFAYQTDEALPKAHMISISVGKRGAGKSTAVVSMIENLKFDRIFVISPTFKSNSILMNQLNIEKDDVFEDADDLSIVPKIIHELELERDDLVRYLKELAEYSDMLKKIHNNSTLLSDDILLKYFYNNRFEKPYHKYGGRNPFCALLIDDCQHSKLFTGKKISNLAIKHRHIAPFETDRPSIGISMFFLVQNYSCISGSLPKSIRNNATNLLLFKNKDLKELEKISVEIGGEVDKETFMKVYDQAMLPEHNPNPFLFVDLHKKDSHPSMFRSKFDKFIVV